MSRKKTRREFLQGRSVDRSSEPAEQLDGLGPSSDRSFPENTASMMRLSRKVMACQFEICFPGAMRNVSDGRQRDVQLALESLESLECLEEQLSFFRPTSEIRRINQLAAEGPVQVEQGLFELLCLAEDIWRDTEGAFDITATPLWQTWGFARRAGSVPSEDQISDALSRVGFRYVELDRRCNTIHFSRPGVQLNLGAIGKGYAIDQCAAKLIAGGMENFLLHGGQSSILAHGSADFWTIGIPHPRIPDRRVAEIKLRNRAIGTSSSRFQSFRHKGKLYGHVIDPRLGRPAEKVLSVTVVAPSAALADSLSTAFYVLGVDKSAAYCQAHSEIGTMLLMPSTRVEDFEIHCFGLDDSDFVIQ